LTAKVKSFVNNDAEFWYLVNPSGIGNIVVTMSGSTHVIVGAYAISGVNQATPIPTTTTQHSTVAGSPTISLTTQNPNSLVLDLPSIYGGVTLGSSTCTPNWDLNIANAITGASSSSLQATAGPVTCGWTASVGGDMWDNAAVEIMAADTSGSGGGGGGGTSCGTQTSIASNFNGNSIAGGNTIWFNSNFKLTSGATDGLTLFFTGQTVTGNDFTASVPDSEVVFSSSATSATTTFDTTHNMWMTTVPLGFGDDIFLSGLAYQVPAGGLPGGENPVTWSGTISSSSPASIQWKWGAAVYTSFADYNSIGVKPLHSTSLDAYHNGDMAGTPENEKSNVIGGARGGGGSNWTGSWSATVAASAAPCPPSSGGSGTVNLTVNDVDMNGNALAGFAVELQDTNGNTLVTNDSPATFSLNAGQTYDVQADSFGACTFDHWTDAGATGDTRSVSIQSDTTLTAVLNCR
jgi:hypothetical protein